MIFDTLTKGEDGLRTVKVRNDNKRKVFVQLNGVKISDITDDILIDIVSDVNVEKIKVIDSGNVTAAQENAVDWVTKVFNSQQEAVDFETLQKDKSCDVILEFSELWFAKKSFACTWNLVQVRLHPEPIIDTYPDEYAFVDDDQ